MLRQQDLAAERALSLHQHLKVARHCWYTPNCTAGLSLHEHVHAGHQCAQLQPHQEWPVTSQTVA